MGEISCTATPAGDNTSLSRGELLLILAFWTFMAVRTAAIRAIRELEELEHRMGISE